MVRGGASAFVNKSVLWVHMLVCGASAGFFFLRAASTGLSLTKATKRMQTSPFFASQAPRTPFPVPSLVGGPSLASAAQAARAVLPRGAEAPPPTTPDVMRIPINGSDDAIEIDAVRNEEGVVSRVALFQLVKSACVLMDTQTTSALTEFLNSRKYFHQVNLEFFNIFNSYLFVPLPYPKPTLIFPLTIV